MAKKKAQDESPDDAPQGDDVASETTEQATPDASEVIAKVVADTNEEIRRFMPRLRASEQEHRDLADQAKEAKKTMESNHLHLSMLCGRLADAMNGNYQPTLPFDAEQKPLPSADQGAAMPIGVLKDHGLTDKMVETLVDHEVATVGKLESLMRADEWWHRKIKGFGEDRITKVIDALMSFRSQNPVPSPDDEPLESQVAGALDDLGILAK
jgi:hypothetical protein